LPVLTYSRFLTDYFHTVVILIIACYFSIKAFTFSEIGSAGHLYDLVKAAGSRNPVAGNYLGTYLTMTSKEVRSSLSFVL
jgi:Na+/proline symporter